MSLQVEPISQTDERAIDGRKFAGREWLDYFERNACELLDVPWDLAGELTAAEHRAIAASLQIFQLGESSEGRHLSRCAKRYADANDDADYYSAIRLFIREEQRHARDLARFMTQNGIERIQKTFSDSVFRFLRKPAGLELSIAVLVTAEIVAQVYYPALQQATQSEILHAICEQIIRDETPHVQFQCERLAILRVGRSSWKRAICHGLQRGLMFGTLFVVWAQHRRVFRAAGQGFRSYWKNIWAAWRSAEAVMKLGAS